MTARVEWMALVLAGAVTAADAAPPPSSPAPDADFLEFLGSWQVEGGRWVDPFQVEDVPGLPGDDQDQRAFKDERKRTDQRPTGPRDDPRSQTAPSSPRRDVMP